MSSIQDPTVSFDLGRQTTYNGPAIDVGSYGPMRRTCKWIVEHDPRNQGTIPGRRKVDVTWIGRNREGVHVWKTETDGLPVQYLTRGQLIYVAQHILGMTEEDMTGENEWATDYLPTRQRPTTGRHEDASEPNESPLSASSSTKANQASTKSPLTDAAGTPSTEASGGGRVKHRPTATSSAAASLLQRATPLRKTANAKKKGNKR